MRSHSLITPIGHHQVNLTWRPGALGDLRVPAGYSGQAAGTWLSVGVNDGAK